MTRLGTPDPLRANATVAAATSALADAIAALPPASRRYVPCTTKPDAWFDGSAEERAAAAELCRGCPLLDPCGQAASDAGERFGVWAGRDRTREFNGRGQQRLAPER